jgi:hypothetical protein
MYSLGASQKVSRFARIDVGGCHAAGPDRHQPGGRPLGGRQLRCGLRLGDPPDRGAESQPATRPARAAPRAPPKPVRVAGTGAGGDAYDHLAGQVRTRIGPIHPGCSGGGNANPVGARPRSRLSLARCNGGGGIGRRGARSRPASRGRMAPGGRRPRLPTCRAVSVARAPRPPGCRDRVPPASRWRGSAASR